MTDAVEIRGLQESEVPALAALARQIWRAHYPGIISEAQIEYMLAERYDEARIRSELQRQDVWWDVLLLNGILSGYTSYFWTGAMSPAKTIKVDKLYLHPRAHRRGYGGMMIDHVAHHMGAHGCSRLTLAVNRHNSTAVAAYRRHGFRIVDTSLKKIGGGFWMDDYIMVKDLTR